MNDTVKQRISVLISFYLLSNNVPERTKTAPENREIDFSLFFQNDPGGRFICLMILYERMNRFLLVYKNKRIFFFILFKIVEC